MHTVWTVLIIASTTIALMTGRCNETVAELFASADEAVRLMLTLLGSMTLWSGLTEILSASGDVDRVGAVFRRWAKPLFPGLKDDACWSAMSMNLSANLLGLGNAATPAGIQAAKLLSMQGEAGMKALAMLLVLDNTSLQLMPSTVISMRQAAGAVRPADIWFPTLIVSGVSMLTGIILMMLVQKGLKKIERIRRSGHGGSGRNHCTQGRSEGC